MKKMINVAVGIISSVTAVEAGRLPVRAILLGAGHVSPDCSTAIKSKGSRARVGSQEAVSVCGTGRRVPVMRKEQCSVVRFGGGDDSEICLRPNGMQAIYGRIRNKDEERGTHVLRDELNCPRLIVLKSKSDDKGKAESTDHDLTKKSIKELRIMALTETANRNEQALRVIVRELAFRSRNADAEVRRDAKTILMEILVTMEANAHSATSSNEVKRHLTDRAQAVRDAISADGTARSKIVEGIMQFAKVANSQTQVR